jgi:hypothetical protein
MQPKLVSDFPDLHEELEGSNKTLRRRYAREREREREIRNKETDTETHAELRRRDRDRA